MVPGPALLTPEAVALDLPTASAGWRIAARAIDVAASVYAFDALVSPLVVISSVGSDATLAIVVALFGSFAVLLAYPVLMEAFCGGRTLGKLALGLRVVRTEGGPIGMAQAAARGALGLLEVWATLGGVATLAVFLSKRDQRLGDMVAGTLVLRERRSSRRLAPVRVIVPPGCEQLVATIDVGAMTSEDYELVRSFLLRWADFAPGQRTAVAARLAAPLWQRFRHPLPVGLGPDYYLACLGAAYQYRHPSLPAAVHAPVPGAYRPPPTPAASRPQGSGR